MFACQRNIGTTIHPLETWPWFKKFPGRPIDFFLNAKLQLKMN